MLAARGVAAAAEGLGNTRRVASNDSSAGRRKNRRADVWLLP